MRTPRILLIAEACNPEWTSVPLVGFNLYNALCEVAEVKLVTQVRNREALLRRVPDRKIEFIDSEALAAPMHKLGRLLTLGRGLGWTTRQAVMWLPYLYFEWLVYKRFRASLARGEFDLIHRVTPLTPTYPSPLVCWTDVPFVMGPLNGGLPWPKGTTRVRFAEMEWLSYVRGAYKLLPYWGRSFGRAACVIAGSRHTLAQLPGRVRERAVYMPENGIDPARFHTGGRRRPSEIEPLQILFVGRLVPYKGAHVVIRAFAGSAVLRERAEVVIVGDGPQRGELEGLVRELGVEDRVRFTGALPQGEVAERMRGASVFTFPSIREFGGGVVMESMACGLPPVVVDYGGPGELITRETGLGIPMGRAEELVEAMRRELEALMGDPGRLDGISAACGAYAAREFTWSAKAGKVLEVYRRVGT